MKIRTKLSAVKWSVLLLVSLVACAPQVSVEEMSNEWISRPLAELKQAMKSPDSYASKIGWKEKTYPLANGHYAFVEPIGPDCYIHWGVNQNDRIVDYQSVGSGCKQNDDENNSTIWNMSPKSSRWGEGW